MIKSTELIPGELYRIENPNVDIGFIRCCYYINKERQEIIISNNCLLMFIDIDKKIESTHNLVFLYENKLIYTHRGVVNKI